MSENHTKKKYKDRDERIYSLMKNVNTNDIKNFVKGVINH